MLNAARVAELKNRTPRVDEVPIKSIGGETVRIRALNLLERDDYNLSLMGDDGKLQNEKLRGNKARLVATCVVDENRATFMSADDVVAAFDPDQIDEIFDQCGRVNGLNKKAIEEAAGNSSSSPTAG